MWNNKGNIITVFRFCVVGVGNTLIDFGVFFLLTSFGVSYFLAQACSYSAGVMNSYVWNRMWTFQVQQKATVQEFFRFILINVFSLSTTFVLLYIFRQIGDMSLLYSKVIATIGGMAVNFAGSRLWVFQPSINERSEGS
ncbi:putative flippase GtrA [Anoxybacillus tepidamans]|uniref:Putative flippase GtrA n=2 Tax=Anoxybacteroides tepidamans TaxID=265948 RepID=A0A7W8ISV5_9BACL|nr:putative flippase GtrA [Anoxybacillus tepidamans]